MISKKDIEVFKDFLESGTIKANITKVALITIVLGTLPFVTLGGVAMGNAVQIFKMFDKNKKYKDKQIQNAIANLHRYKLIEYVSEKNGITTVKITKKGEVKLKSFSIDLMKINKPKKWDGKWRVVMFDLPVRFSKARHSLRLKLKQLGFVQFQKSVWIYPYPCTDEILFIAEYYKVRKYIDMMTVLEISDEKNLKERFDL